MTIEVALLSHTDNPIRSLYMSYRTCYSQLTPQQVAQRIEDERITQEQMVQFVEERMKTGHVSPLEQVVFEFAISGVSRSFSHQFVRHRVGISFEQQSQRYVTYKGGQFPYTIPPSIRDTDWEDAVHTLFGNIGWLYDQMVEDGIPAEDARFVLPNATNTNFKITVNFASLLHIADLRLCTRAQWEFRKVVALMRAEVMKVCPEIGRYLQPKCGELRTGYCDESYKDYQACPLSKVRPHKDDLLKNFERAMERAKNNGYKVNVPVALGQAEWAAVEDVSPGEQQVV